MTEGRAPCYFPGSVRYAPSEDVSPLLVREAPGGGRVFSYTERHLQAVWYDPRWRPSPLQGHRGEIIHVESPGTWNLEAGPDFLGATLLVGPDRRRVCGDVEVHVFPAGWKQHSHRRDRRYRNVCLHVTYFEGSLPDEELPAGAFQVALRTPLKADPSFAFEHIDVTAYPYGGRADVPPCRHVLASWPVECRAALLDAAGHERMRQKSARFAEALRERGVDQVFYEAFLAALGYQHNKPPFQRLAGLLPAERLRAVAGGSSLRAYAVMAGLSGLLPADGKSQWDEETRSFVRELWDIWWRERDRLPPPMDRHAWRLQGIRPLNHPLRRMAAAACLFTEHGDGLALLEKWTRFGADQWLAGMQADLTGNALGYWPWRASWGGRKSDVPVALIGQDRGEALALNVVIPMAAACGFDPGRVDKLLQAVKPEAMNRILRQSAFYVLGPDHPSFLLATANRRQGLLQIFQDHCLSDRSRCFACAFPGLLSRFPDSLLS